MYTVESLVNELGLNYSNLIGSKKRIISGASSIDNISSNELSFCTSGYKYKLKSCHNCSIIVNKLIETKYIFDDISYIFVDSPRLMFIRSMHILYPNPVEPKIFIGKNVFIGKNTIIGGDGFGYERNKNNELEKFPSIGGVILEDNVEIGSNTSIDRGTLGNTKIGIGTKIDNLVHIAHNVNIGKHCEIIAHAMIAGSSIIGDYTRIAPGAQILDKINIGKNVLVGLGAVVIKDVPDNAIVAGVPAKILRYQDPLIALSKTIAKKKVKLVI